MEKLIRHLEQLIIQHDYAILPEFGGFIINYVPAKIDETTHVVSAPHKEVFFNPALNYNDGLLADAVQRDENISFRKANLFIGETVEELKKRLKNGETVLLGKIGSLRLDENGQTEFLPADAYDFLPDNLSNYNLRLGNLLHEEDSKEIVLKIPGNKRRIYKYAAILIALIALAVLIPTLHTHYPAYFAKMNPFNFFAADTLAVLDSMPEYSHLVVDTTSASYEHQVTDTTKVVKETVPPTPAVEQTVNEIQPPADNISSPPATAGTTTTQSAVKPEAKNITVKPVAKRKPLAKKAPSASTPWHVIAGSYHTKAEAMAKAHELQRQSAFRAAWLFYSPRLQKSNFPIVAANTLVFAKNGVGNTLAWHIIVANFETTTKAKRFIDMVAGPTNTPLAAYGSNSAYRIVAASFKSQQEAITKLREIRKNRQFVSAWVLYNPALLNYPVVAPSKMAKTQPQKPVASLQKTATITPKEWHIIVAQFQTANGARKFATQTTQKEKIPLSIYGVKNIYRVVAGSFVTRKEATVKIQEIRRHEALKTALILHSSVLLNYPVQQTNSQVQATASQPQSGIALLRPGTWYVIVANFYTAQQAQNYVNTIGKKENVSLGVIKDNALYRVIGGTFNNQNAAVEKAKELCRHKALEQTWTLCKPAK